MVPAHRNDDRNRPGAGPDVSKPGGASAGDKVFLIGFSGTGKSHSGRLASKELGAVFCDTDRVVSARAGKTIVDIFEQDGEEEFRRLERDALRAIAGKRGARVISTGGGAPVDPGNRDLMKEAGVTIRLTATAETIFGRLSRGRRRGRSGRPGRRRSRAGVRPLLSESMSDDANIDRIRQLLERREEAYHAAADATIDTDGREPPDVAAEIVAVVRRLTGISGAKR